MKLKNIEFNFHLFVIILARMKMEQCFEIFVIPNLIIQNYDNSTNYDFIF